MQVHFFDTLGQQDTHRRMRGITRRTGGTRHLGDDDTPAVLYIDAPDNRRCMTFLRFGRHVSVFYNTDTDILFSQAFIDAADRAWHVQVDNLPELPTGYDTETGRIGIENFLIRNRFTAFQRTRETENTFIGPYARPDGAVCYVRANRSGYAVSDQPRTATGEVLQPGAVQRASTRRGVSTFWDVPNRRHVLVDDRTGAETFLDADQLREHVERAAIRQRQRQAKKELKDAAKIKKAAEKITVTYPEPEPVKLLPRRRAINIT